MKITKIKWIVRYVLRNKLKVVDDYLLSIMMLERLQSLPKKNWLYYYHCFNTWRLPEEFYDLHPSWLNSNEIHNTDRLMVIHGRAMQAISNEFTTEQILRYSNVNIKNNMTDDEFTYWWNCDKRNQDELFYSYYPRARQFKSIRFWEDDVWDKLKYIELVTDKTSNLK